MSNHTKNNDAKWPPLPLRAEAVCPCCHNSHLVRTGVLLGINDMTVYYRCDDCDSSVNRHYEIALKKEDFEPLGRRPAKRSASDEFDDEDGGLST